MSYLPVGSQKAAEHYARACLDNRQQSHQLHADVHGLESDVGRRVHQTRNPSVGDDIKSQVGATIVHRSWPSCSPTEASSSTARTSSTRGQHDFLNMLNRDRLGSKKISKTEAVQANLPTMESPNVHIGPSDYVPWERDNKICFLPLEGRGFGGAKIELEARLSVDRDPRRRQPARRRAVRPRRRARLRAVPVDARRGGAARWRARAATATQPEPVRLDVNVDAYVPADYIPYEQAKIDVHRRIAAAREVADVALLRDELEDRFGPVPEPLANLMALQQARIKLGQAGARRRVLPRRPAGRDADRPRRRAGRAVARRPAPRRSTSRAARRSRVRVPEDPQERFPAVVQAADVLLAVVSAASGCNEPLSSPVLMKLARRFLALGAFFVVAIVLAACGGDSIPGNSVAKVGDTSITKDDFNHWLKIAAISSQGQTDPDVASGKKRGRDPRSAGLHEVRRAKKTRPRPSPPRASRRRRTPSSSSSARRSTTACATRSCSS